MHTVMRWPIFTRRDGAHALGHESAFQREFSARKYNLLFKATFLTNIFNYCNIVEITAKYNVLCFFNRLGMTISSKLNSLKNFREVSRAAKTTIRSISICFAFVYSFFTAWVLCTKVS